MRPLTDIEKRALIAVRKLRDETLLQGNPFMIYDKSLPTGQYYMEYPDGKIKIVSVSPKLNDFVIESELSPQEADHIRSRLNPKEEEATQSPKKNGLVPKTNSIHKGNSAVSPIYYL